MSTGAQRIRRSDYRSMPWRNGKGMTLEIARRPLSGSQFDWRLSLASVTTTGPFSCYPGYQRSVTLVSGEGFRLDLQGHAPALLDEPGASTQFAGEGDTVCTLLGGECTDLSLIVREPGENASESRMKP